MLLVSQSAIRRGLGATPSAVAPAVAPSAMNAASVVAQACGTSPNYCNWKSGANKKGGLQPFLAQAAQTRFLPDPSSAIAEDIFDASFSCSGAMSLAGSSAASAAQAGAITKSSAGIASGFLAASPATGPLAPIVAGIGAIVSFITGIFGAHHAHAVQGEAQDICSAVPQINSVLAQIDAGLAAGSITPAQAQQQYSSLQSQLSSALKQNTTYKTGDTLWAFNLGLQVAISMRNHDLQNGLLTSGAPGPWTAAGAGASGAVSQLASSLGVSSSTLLIGAAILAGVLLL